MRCGRFKVMNTFIGLLSLLVFLSSTLTVLPEVNRGQQELVGYFEIVREKFYSYSPSMQGFVTLMKQRF